MSVNVFLDRRDILFWAAQVLGFIICILSSLSYFTKKKSSYLYAQLSVNVLYAAQYFMLGSVAGGINNIVSLAKYIFFAHNAKKGKENTKASILFFCALSIVLGIPAISGWHTFIPLITSLLFTYAIWQENPIVLRIIAMICNVLWVIFNFQVQAYVSMVYSIFEFIVAFITLILIIRKGKKDELQDS